MSKRKDKALENLNLAHNISTKITKAIAWRQPHKDKWDRFYKLYRSYLEETTYPWQSNLFIPYSFSTIETIAPKMVANKPQIDIMPREAGDEEYANLQSKLIDFEWEKMRMNEILPDAVKEALMYGTCILKVYWDRKEVEAVEEREVDENFPELGTVEEKVVKVLNDNPIAELVDLYDFFWDPIGTTIDNCRWVAHKMWRTKNYLKDMAKKGIYKNIDLVTKSDFPASDDEKSSRRNVLGISLPDAFNINEEKNNLVELIEYWEDDRVVVVANREVIIRDEKNPYEHGKKPFVKIVDQSVPHEFLGVGELEPIESLQYELNDRRNQRMDNITLILNRMWKVKNGAGVDEDELVSEAGGVVHTNDMDGLEPLVMQDVTGSSYQEETLIKADIQQTTGASDYSRGVGNESLGNETATGISLIQEAGNSRFRLKIANLEAGIQRIGEMMVSLNAQFIDEEKSIRIIGDNGAQWETIKPTDLKSDFDVIVQSGSTLPSNQAVERKQIMDMYQLFAGDPSIDQNELKRRVLDSFGVKNIDKLLIPQQPAMPGMEGMVNTAGQTSQEGVLQATMQPANQI